MKPDIKEALDRYVKTGCPTGDFLRAVLENDFMQAFGRADEDNTRDMKEIAAYVYNEMPSTCHGSPTIVRDWTRTFIGQCSCGVEVWLVRVRDSDEPLCEQCQALQDQKDAGRV